MTELRDSYWSGPKENIETQIEDLEFSEGEIVVKCRVPEQNFVFRKSEDSSKRGYLLKKGRCEIENAEIDGTIQLESTTAKGNSENVPSAVKNLSFDLVKTFLEEGYENILRKAPKSMARLGSSTIENLLDRDPELLVEANKVKKIDNYLHNMTSAEIWDAISKDALAKYSGTRWSLIYENSDGAYRSTGKLRVDDARRKLLRDILEEGHFCDFEGSFSYRLMVPKNEDAERLVWLMATEEIFGYDEIKVLRNADDISESHSKALARVL